MKLTSLIADIVPSEIYGVPAPEPVKDNVTTIMIAVSIVTIGVVTGVILLVKKMLKKKNNNKDAQEQKNIDQNRIE